MSETPEVLSIREILKTWDTPTAPTSMSTLDLARAIKARIAELEESQTRLKLENDDLRLEIDTLTSADYVAG